MDFLGILFPIVYTALFAFAVLFLATTPNNKFYPKILFAIFVSSLATWGWCEILSNLLPLRAYILPINQFGFFSAEIAVQSLLLISLQVAGIKLKNQSVLIVALVLVSSFTFIPNFIIVGYQDMGTYVDLIPGFGDTLYNTTVILFSVVFLILFAIAYRKDDELTKKRIGPIVIAFIFSLFVGIFFNIFLPGVYNIEQFTSIAPLCVVSVVIALAYSIYKWNLLGITVNDSVSYSQISQMWKTKSPNLYRSIRETYFSSLQYFPAGITAQKIFFPTGKVNKKGNVYLFGLGFYRFICLYYFFLRKMNKERIFVLGDQALPFIVITNKKISGLPSEATKFIIQKFSALALYQKSAENVFETHITNSESGRAI